MEVTEQMKTHSWNYLEKKKEFGQQRDMLCKDIETTTDSIRILQEQILKGAIMDNKQIKADEELTNKLFQHLKMDCYHENDFTVIRDSAVKALTKYLLMREREKN